MKGDFVVKKKFVSRDIFFAGMLLIILLMASNTVQARVDRNWIQDDQPDGLLMTSLNSGTERLRFIQISDPHVGGGDYGTAGYDDLPPVGDQGGGAQYLRTCVDWINDNYGYYGIEFVIVSGDMTHSAEWSEFSKAKEILDSLEIPYVPVLGNHDVWPYTDDDEAEYGYGDEYFKDTFDDTFDDLAQFFDNWDDGTRLDQVWNPEVGYYCYFQNFSFDFEGFHFVIADFNTREHAPFDEPGIGPEADMHNFDGGTWPWFQDDIDNANHGDDNIYIIAHHPLRNTAQLPLFAFSSGEYSSITSFLNGYKNNIGLWAAGHIHYNRTYAIKRYWSTICYGHEVGSYESMDDNDGERYGEVINKVFNGKIYKCKRN